MKKMVLSILLGAFAISCIYGLYVVMTRKFETIEINVLMTIGTITFYTVVGMICSGHFEEKKTKWLGYLGVAFCVIAGIFAVWTTWSGERFDHIGLWWRLFLITLALGHACLILSVKPKSSFVKILIAVAIIAAVSDTLIAVLIDRRYWDDNYVLIMTIAIIGVVSTIAVPLVNSFYDASKSEKIG